MRPAAGEGGWDFDVGDARCDDVWLKYDGKGSFLLIGELETSPI